MRYISGFVFLNGNGAFSWRSKKQTFLAQSILEAEYVAMSFYVREYLWLRRIRSETSDQNYKAIHVFGDNQGMTALSKEKVQN